MLQEDVGNTARSGRVWSYDPKADTLTQLAEHDVSRFGTRTTPATRPFTRHDESSGVIDVTNPFHDAHGWGVYLLDTQAHYPFGVEGSADRTQIVENGRLQDDVCR
jgi:hypothetical protein